MDKNKYVEMICYTAGQQPERPSLTDGYILVPLKEASQDNLYSCYHTAFLAGDAGFFFEQNQGERREYFNTLGYEQAVLETGSSVIRLGEEAVGFTYVIPYGITNRHISCMCVTPKHQRCGVGTTMLKHALYEACTSGLTSITLGTETGMSAYRLYRNNGFDVMEAKRS